MKKTEKRKGFTIVELIVSVGIFSMVFVSVAGSFISILDAYQKITTSRTNIDNLALALESLVRGAKTGEKYHCTAITPLTDPQDCVGGGTQFSFVNKNIPRLSGGLNRNDPIVYKFVECVSPNNPVYCGRIQRSDDGGTTFYPVTVAPPALDIKSAKFYVTGTKPLSDVSQDIFQPQVTLIIKGQVGVKKNVAVPFSMQTTITQRLLDL